MNHELLPLVLVLACAAVHAPASAQLPEKACLPSIADSAVPGDCVTASTVPAGGSLLPLGPELFVNPTGEVGINTMFPAYTLDVAGDVRASGRLAFGNDAGIGPYSSWNRLWDFSQTIADFSSASSWSPYRCLVELDPLVDLTGADTTYIYSQMFGMSTASGNDKDYEFLQGIQQNSVHDGTGSVYLMGGIFSGAQNNHGHVEYMGAGSNASIGRWESTTTWNAAAEFWSGHYDAGFGGTIENDFGLYVYAPWTGGDLKNHYGIFLEDQDVGDADSYALYSKGGTVAIWGDVGIGTDTPTAKLDVQGDFVASGTKSFVAPHPVDPSKEIRFVCLEGNEAGTYFRGNTRLVDGTAIIDVPEAFRHVTEDEGMTVQVTAKGPRAGLWVESENLERIVVRGERDVELSYFVNGVRKGYADFEVVRERDTRESNAARPEHAVAREAARRAKEGGILGLR